MSNIGTVNHYAKEIPDEVKTVIKGLDDDIRVAIIVLLLKKDKLSFTRLKNELRIKSNSSLSYHLSILQDGGLVANYVELRKDKHLSYYTATDLAMNVFRSLFGLIFLPSSKNIEVLGNIQGASSMRFPFSSEEISFSVYDLVKSAIRWNRQAQVYRSMLKYKSTISPQIRNQYMVASTTPGT